MRKVYLGLGANLGDRKTNLRQALKLLGGKVAILRRSSLYDTAPVGNERQPRFLNMVCAGETNLEPHALLTFVKSIESEMGRQPGPVNSPRPIDIDILFYDKMVMSESGLIIPHPRIAERVFVLLPLAEISPTLKHPVSGNTVKEMLDVFTWTSQDIMRVEEEPEK